MPRIPYQLPENQLPGSSGGVQINPDMAAAPEMASARMGEQAAKIGNESLMIAGRYDALEQMARDQVQRARVKTEIWKDSMAVQESFLNRSDWGNFVPDLEKAQQQNMEKYRSMVGNDKTFEMLMPEIAHHQAIEASNINKLARRKEHDKWFDDYAGVGGTVETYQKLLSNPNMTPEERDSLSGEFINTTQEAIRSGWLTAAQGIKGQEIALRGADLTRAKRMAIYEPDAWLDLTDKRKEFKYLDEDNILDLDNRAVIQIRQEGTRLDKLTRATQKDNQSKAIDLLVAGKLDIDTLKAMRQRDPETGQPGLSDEFYVKWRSNLASGKDVITDPDTFNRLFVDPKKTIADVNKAADQLSPQDQRILLGQINHESSTQLAEARYYRRQEESEGKREERQTEREANLIRNNYYRDGKNFIKVSLGKDSKSVKADDVADIYRAYEAAYADKATYPGSELITYAENLTKKYNQKPWDKLMDWITGDAEKQKSIPQSALPQPMSPSSSPITPQRKPLSEIFGGKR